MESNSEEIEKPSLGGSCLNPKGIQFFHDDKDAQ